MESATTPSWVEGIFWRVQVLPWYKQFPQDLIQTDVESQLGIDWSTTIRNCALVSHLMFEQSIELGVFFKENYFFEKPRSKSHFNIIYQKCTYCMKRSTPFLPVCRTTALIFFIYQVIEERRKYDNVKHSYRSKNDTISTVFIQNMITFSTVIY